MAFLAIDGVVMQKGPEIFPKHLDPNELEVGDFLFFMDFLGSPQHVAVYAGERAGAHFITHGVTDPYHSIMTTRLKSDDLPYRVFRLKDPILAFNIALRMHRWCLMAIPFSDSKHTMHINLIDSVGLSHPKTGGEAQCELAESYFLPNYFRYLEYAAHPDGPFHPKDESLGFYCSEALIAATHIEILRLIGAVQPSPANEPWVTDHHLMDLTEIEQLSPPNGYLPYLNRLQKREYPDVLSFKEPSESKQEFSKPSFTAWNQRFSPNIIESIEQLDYPLRLDSKLGSPWAIMVYCLKHPDHWLDLGSLKIEKKLAKITGEDDKILWKAYVAKLFQNAPLRRKQSLSCSPEPTHELITPFMNLKLKRSLSMSDLDEITKDPLSEMVQTHWDDQLKKCDVSPVKNQVPKIIRSISPSPTVRKLF